MLSSLPPAMTRRSRPLSDREQSEERGETQYFAAQPPARSSPREIRVRVRDIGLVFMTDRGVFSYGRVDRGSKLLIETVDEPDGPELLDWGCGWGLLGIVAARAWPQVQVTMVEVNERACELARENARINHAEGLEIICGDAFKVLGERSFDTILCNPPISAGREVVLRVFDDAAARLSPGGTFWMVAATRKGAKTLARLLGERFADVEQVRLGGGFRVYAAAQPTSHNQPPTSD